MVIIVDALPSDAALDVQAVLTGMGMQAVSALHLAGERLTFARLTASSDVHVTSIEAYK